MFHTPQGALRRGGQRLGSCRLASAKPLVGSIGWECSINLALWEFEVLCCQYLQLAKLICLSNLPQHVMVNRCRSKLVNVVSGVPLGSAFCPLLFLLYTSELFSYRRICIGDADDSTLMAVVPSLGVTELQLQSPEPWPRQGQRVV